MKYILFHLIGYVAANALLSFVFSIPFWVPQAGDDLVELTMYFLAAQGIILILYGVLRWFFSLLMKARVEDKSKSLYIAMSTIAFGLAFLFQSGVLVR